MPRPRRRSAARLRARPRRPPRDRSCGRRRRESECTVNASTSKTPIRWRIAAAAADSAPARHASPRAAAIAHIPSRPYCDAPLVVQRHRVQQRAPEYGLRLVDLAADQQHAPIWFPADDRVKRSPPASAISLARSKCASASSRAPRSHDTRPRETRVIASPHLLPTRCSRSTASSSSRVAVAMSGSGSCTRAVARAASAIAAASSSPLSVNSRTHSPRPATTSGEGRCHISPHSAKNHATARVCGRIGCSLPSSSSIQTRTPPKNPRSTSR